MSCLSRVLSLLQRPIIKSILDLKHINSNQRKNLVSENLKFINFVLQYHFNTHINILNVVQEKLFRPLETSVVPVVYGGRDVHKVAPPHSYIDVRDFKSPKHLAKYLLHLDKNKEEYMAYFKWKENYRVRLGNIQSTSVFCQLCEYMFTNNMRTIYSSFQKKIQCENPTSLPFLS